MQTNNLSQMVLEKVAKIIAPELWGAPFGYPDEVHSDDALRKARSAAEARAHEIISFLTSPPADDVVEAVARAIREKVCVSDAHAIDIADAAISAMPRTSPELVEAARKAAERFREYQAHHEARALPSDENGTYGAPAALEKAERNREMAEMLEAALRNAEQPDPDLGKIERGHVCKHGVRWPHACNDCDEAAWAARPAPELQP